MRNDDADVVVIGGGPAGSAAARLLARWGRRVLLLTRPQPTGRRGLAESVPPSAGKLFEILGVESALEDAGFVPAPGNTVWWADRSARRVDFRDGTGWQVERGRLQELLLGSAADAGATVRRDATVEAVEVDAGEPRVTARFAGAGSERSERRSVRASMVFDCTGRAGVMASGGLRRREDGPRLTALVGAWVRDDGWDAGEGSRTLVESYNGGWAWSIPVDRRTRYFTAMVDPDVTDLGRGGSLTELYRDELDRTRHLSALLAGSVPVGRPGAWDATPYSAVRFGGPGFLLVGDAGSFIDPLSSYGVKKALASGWLAAVVANTILRRPTMEEDAIAFFEAREREVYRSYAEETASFYAEGAAVHDHPFWRRRAGRGEGASPFPATGAPTRPEIGSETEEANGAGAEPDVDALRRDPSVRAAFERLRTVPEIELRPSEPFRTTRTPTVRDRELVFEERLITPRFPDGIRYVRDIDLCRIAWLCAREEPEANGVGDLYDRYRERTGPAPLPDFLGALSVLLAEGVVENAADPDPPRAGSCDPAPVEASDRGEGGGRE